MRLAKLTFWSAAFLCGSLYFTGTAQAREYDPRRGIFTSRDPSFSEPNYYVYTKNNPVNNTDPTGLLTVEVHGTHARNAVWVEEGSSFSKASGLTDIWRIRTAGNLRVDQIPLLLRDLRNIPGVDGMGRFRWSGDDTHTARLVGGVNLAAYMAAVHRRYPKEPFNLIGHSHGGNVVAVATARAPHIPINSVVYLAKPWFYLENRKTRVMQDLYRGNYANVGRILNLYNHEDEVQTTTAISFPGVPYDAETMRLLVGRQPVFVPRLTNQLVYSDVGWKDAHTIMHGREIAPGIGAWVNSGRWPGLGMMQDDSPYGMAERLNP